MLFLADNLEVISLLYPSLKQQINISINTSRQANYVLEKYAKENGIPVKSSHKLRKTCGSNLSRKGMPARACADYLGNSEEVFMRYYNFDTSTENELLKILDRDTPSDTSESEALKVFDTKQSREVS